MAESIASFVVSSMYVFVPGETYGIVALPQLFGSKFTDTFAHSATLI